MSVVSAGKSHLKYGLTLWPEWLPCFTRADLMAAGLAKSGENRTWAPTDARPDFQPGDWLALHAGAHIGGTASRVSTVAGLGQANATMDRAIRYSLAARDAMQRGSCRSVSSYTHDYPPIQFDDVPIRCIVAVVQVEDWPSGPWPDGWYMPDSPWYWRCAPGRTIVLPQPVPKQRGAQKLWPLLAEELEEIRTQTRELIRDGREAATATAVARLGLPAPTLHPLGR